MKKEKLLDGDKVGLLEKSGFLGFSMSTNIAYNFKSLYYLSFLTLVLGIDVWIAGVMLTIGTIWDAVNDPLIALFCSNHKFKNGDKVRPYTLWCCIPWSITIILLFVNFQITQSWTIVISLIVYFIFEALYTFLCMPYNSMASLATKNDAERNSINAFRSIGGCLGSGIGAVATLPIVQLFGGLRDHKQLNSSDSMPLIYTAIFMGLICIAGSLFHYFTSKERVKAEGGDNDESIGLIQAYKMLFRCKSWIINMCFIICYGITTALVMQNVNYYATFVLGDSTAATPILAIYLVLALITGVITPTIDRKIGRKLLMLITIAIMVVGKIPFIFAPSSLVCIYINAFSVGIGGTVTFIVFNTNRNNIADVLEAQNHRRIDTLVAGGDNLITKLAEALTIQVMTLVLSLCKFESTASTQPREAIGAIEAFLGWVPMVVTLFMIICVLKIDIKKELEESKAKNPLPTVQE